MFSLELYISFIMMIILMVCVLVGVAFLTLFERKILGYIQIRKGPNKVGYMGILQPFSDAIKLFNKEQTFPLVSNYLIYYYSPIFSMFLSLFIWILMPYYMVMFNFSLGLVFMVCCLSLGVYGVMMAGWSSNSVYSLLGGLRSVAQTISYEVSFFLILLSYLILIEGFNLLDLLYYQSLIWFIFLSFPLALIYFVSSLAETNRTPFDFAEGESELVSGFNVEYSSGGFAMIFMAEYSMILFMSMLFSVLFLGSNLLSLFFYFKVVFICFLFIWVRGTLPRYRYDKLMYLAWKSFLPISLNFFLFFIGLKILIFSFL